MAVATLLYAAIVAGLFLFLGNKASVWMVLLYFVLLLVAPWAKTRIQRGRPVRRAFQCRLLLPAREASRQRWVRARATHYPDRLTLELQGADAPTDDPLVLPKTNFSETRIPTFRDSLLRFPPGWRIAAFDSNAFDSGAGAAAGTEILVAAPAEHCAAMAGPAAP